MKSKPQWSILKPEHIESKMVYIETLTTYWATRPDYFWVREISSGSKNSIFKFIRSGASCVGQSDWKILTSISHENKFWKFLMMFMDGSSLKCLISERHLILVCYPDLHPGYRSCPLYALCFNTQYGSDFCDRALCLIKGRQGTLDGPWLRASREGVEMRYSFRRSSVAVNKI